MARLDGRSAARVVRKVNEGGADRDFSIEGSGDSRLFFTDAGNDRIGIGTGDPAHKLDVAGHLGVSECFSLSVSDVSHGMTAHVADSVIFVVEEAFPDSGGVALTGYSESILGISLVSRYSIDDTAKSTSASAAITIQASKKSGTTISYPGSSANVLAVQAHSRTAFIVNEAGTVWADGKVLIGASGNANMDRGLTIDQFSADNEIISLRSTSDVDHAMTDFVSAETFGRFRKAQAGSGGLLIEGLKDGDGPHAGFALTLIGSLEPAADTSTNSSAVSIVQLQGRVHDGSSSITEADDAANVVGFANGELTRLLFKGNGDTWQAGNPAFNGAALSAKQAVTGSRGGNAALQSLITALANIGLVTDSSIA